MTPVIELAGVSKAFGPVKVLTGVDFALYPGEVHALIGENGAGKSTLMSILYGFYDADSGEIRLGGAPRRIAGSKDAIAAGNGHGKIRSNYQTSRFLPVLSLSN